MKYTAGLIGSADSSGRSEQKLAHVKSWKWVCGQVIVIINHTSPVLSMLPIDAA